MLLLPWTNGLSRWRADVSPDFGPGRTLSPWLLLLVVSKCLFQSRRSIVSFSSIFSDFVGSAVLEWGHSSGGSLSSTRSGDNSCRFGEIAHAHTVIMNSCKGDKMPNKCVWTILHRVQLEKLQRQDGEPGASLDFETSFLQFEGAWKARRDAILKQDSMVSMTCTVLLQMSKIKQACPFEPRAKEVRTWIASRPNIWDYFSVKLT